MIHNKLRKRLRHAADLLEALAGDGPPIEAMRDGASGHSVIPTSDADYVDMASGQMGVSGGVRQVNVDAQVKLRMAAIREVAMIKELLAELDSEPKKGRRPARRPLSVTGDAPLSTAPLITLG